MWAILRWRHHMRKVIVGSADNYCDNYCVIQSHWSHWLNREILLTHHFTERNSGWYYYRLDTVPLLDTPFLFCHGQYRSNDRVNMSINILSDRLPTGMKDSMVMNKVIPSLSFISKLQWQYKDDNTRTVDTVNLRCLSFDCRTILKHILNVPTTVLYRWFCHS